MRQTKNKDITVEVSRELVLEMCDKLESLAKCYYGVGGFDRDRADVLKLVKQAKAQTLTVDYYRKKKAWK